MPVTMMPPNSGKQPVYWVTYYDGKQVDPMKRFNLAPVEDELLYFRAWLAHKYKFIEFDAAAHILVSYRMDE